MRTECERMCTIRLLDCVKAFGQSSHLYGFSPLWMRMCVFRLPMCVNVFWQMEHWNGLLVMCERTCLDRSPALGKLASQCVHWKHFWLPFNAGSITGAPMLLRLPRRRLMGVDCRPNPG